MPKLSLDTKKLQKYMEDNNLTEAELARRMDVSRSTVNRVIRGERGAGTEFIGKLLDAFPELNNAQFVFLSPRSRLAIADSRLTIDSDSNQAATLESA